MSVVLVRATCECDGCGKRFTVDIDPSEHCVGNDSSVFDLGVSCVAAGDGLMEVDDSYHDTSVVDDKMLCGTCTGERT